VKYQKKDRKKIYKTKDIKEENEQKHEKKKIFSCENF